MTSERSTPPNRARAVRMLAGRVLLFVVATLIAVAFCESAVRIALPHYLAIQTDRGMWTHHARWGWITRPNFEAEQQFGRGQRVGVRTNSAGFREAEVPPVPPPGRTRLVLLGDSFAFGYGVQIAERLSEVIEAADPRVECVNLGVSGYSTDQELLVLRDYALGLDPDVVLLMYVTNDPWANRRTRGHGHPKPAFVMRDGELVLTNVPVPPAGRLLRLKYGLARRSALFNLVRSTYVSLVSGTPLDRWLSDERLGGPAAETSNSEDRITRALILQIRREVEAAGARFVLMTVFPGARMDGNIPANEQLLDWCRAEGLRCIDSYPALLEAHRADPGQPLFLDDRQHWNARGHRSVGLSLLDALRTNGWIP